MPHESEQLKGKDVIDILSLAVEVRPADYEFLTGVARDTRIGITQQYEVIERVWHKGALAQHRALCSEIRRERTRKIANRVLMLGVKVGLSMACGLGRTSYLKQHEEE